MTWFVYGIYVEDVLQYIGCTEYLENRRNIHICHTFYGVEFDMKTLQEFESRDEALAVEKHMIATHLPPRNYDHKPTAGHETIETTRVGAGGKLISLKMRLKPGQMHPDKARDIWRSPDHKTDGQALALMPGWSCGKARFMFGPRKG